MSHARFPRLLLFVVAVLIGTGRLTSASDWPRFRGPNGAGISNDPGVPMEISEGKNQLWKIKIPGAGNSSPVVAGGRIFLQAASEDGNERTLYCLKLSDGEVLWKHAAPGATAKTHKKSSLASCTAVVEGKRVFVPFWDGKELSMAAFDIDGKPLWNTPLGSITTQHGAGHSPIVVGSKVIFLKDEDGASEIFALDADDGRIVWRREQTPGKSCSYAAPMILEQPGEEPELVLTNTTGISGCDPVSGSEKWKWIWSTNKLQLRTIGVPTLCQGMLFITGGNGPGARHAVGVSMSSRRTSVDESAPVWETNKLFPYVPSLLARGESLFFVNDAGIAACAEAKTGKIQWQQRLGGDFTASPVLVESRIYAVSEQGDVRVFAADEKEYRELSAGKLDEGAYASPAIADGRLIIRGTEHLYCFGTKP